VDCHKTGRGWQSGEHWHRRQVREHWPWGWGASGKHWHRRQVREHWQWGASGKHWKGRKAGKHWQGWVQGAERGDAGHGDGV